MTMPSPLAHTTLSRTIAQPNQLQAYLANPTLQNSVPTQHLDLMAYLLLPAHPVRDKEATSMPLSAAVPSCHTRSPALHPVPLRTQCPFGWQLLISVS